GYRDTPPTDSPTCEPRRERANGEGAAQWREAHRDALHPAASELRTAALRLDYRSSCRNCRQVARLRRDRLYHHAGRPHSRLHSVYRRGRRRLSAGHRSSAIDLVCRLLLEKKKKKNYTKQ